MATITRTEEMFTYSAIAAPRKSFWTSFNRALSRLMLPAWVIQYGEDKAAEIERQRFYYS